MDNSELYEFLFYFACNNNEIPNPYIYWLIKLIVVAKFCTSENWKQIRRGTAAD